MSSSAGSSSAAPNEEFESIKNILHTLGIREYDPLVVVALSEYSRRYASELLCDMKDFSVHANKTEIDMEDMMIATRLSSVKTSGLPPYVAFTHISAELNSREIPEIPSSNSSLHRIPGVVNSAADVRFGPQSQLSASQWKLDLLTPTFSFVPGVEAYPTTDSIVSRKAMKDGTADQIEYSGSSAKKPKFGHHSQSATPIPISLLPMRERENFKLQEKHAESLSRNQRTQLGSSMS